MVESDGSEAGDEDTELADMEPEFDLEQPIDHEPIDHEPIVNSLLIMSLLL